MSLEFLDNVGQHEYRLDGVVVPSVTGILKAAGLVDFSHIPPNILGAALERGTTVHKAIHFSNENDLDVGGFMGEFPGYAGYLQAWLTFRETKRFRPIVCERRIASRVQQVAGTLDVLGVMDGHAALIDYKTAITIDSVCPDLQLAAYDVLAREWAASDPALAEFFREYPFTDRFAIQLRKDGTFRLHKYNDPTLYRQFLTLVQAYHIVAKRRPKEMAARVA